MLPLNSVRFFFGWLVAVSTGAVVMGLCYHFFVGGSQVLGSTVFSFMVLYQVFLNLIRPNLKTEEKESDYL